MEELSIIRGNLNLQFGSWNDEEIEQLLCVKYIHPNMNILELGSNIGRVSLIVASILNKGDGKLVTLETNKDIYDKLVINIQNNCMNIFHLNAGLSIRPLSYSLSYNGWISYPTDEISQCNILNEFSKENWQCINTVSYSELEQKYNIIFDTLIIDCEGAFYFILKDNEELLININLIIIENDCFIEEHSKFIFEILNKYKFNVVESVTSDIAWGYCKDFFWQVYKK